MGYQRFKVRVSTRPCTLPLIKILPGNTQSRTIKRKKPMAAKKPTSTVNLPNQTSKINH